MSAISVEATSTIEARLIRIQSDVAHPDPTAGEARPALRDRAHRL